MGILDVGEEPFHFAAGKVFACAYRFRRPVRAEDENTPFQIPGSSISKVG